MGTERLQGSVKRGADFLLTGFPQRGPLNNSPVKLLVWNQRDFASKRQCYSLACCWSGSGI